MHCSYQLFTYLCATIFLRAVCISLFGRIRRDINLYVGWCPMVTLSLTGYSDHITKVRVYSSTTDYKDYTSYNNMAVFPGHKVAFYHSNSREWRYEALGGGYRGLGQGTVCHFTVPSSASGPAALFIYAFSAFNGDNLYLHGSLGWVRDVTPALGE